MAFYRTVHLTENIEGHYHIGKSAIKFVVDTNLSFYKTYKELFDEGMGGVEFDGYDYHPTQITPQLIKDYLKVKFAKYIKEREC